MWFTLGILSGLFFALMGLVNKKILVATDAYINSFGEAFFALPFLILALILFGSWADFGPGFWPAFSITLALNVVGSYLFMKSLSLEEMSSVLPLLSFTPVFLIFTSAVFLGEFPSFLGIFGIVLIVCGSYFLNLKNGSGILGPIKSLLQSKGSQLMMITAFLYAFTSNFDKMAILNSNPFTFLVTTRIAASVIFLILILKKSKVGIRGIKINFNYLSIIGFFSAISLLTQMLAINMAIVPYVISLKRTSGFFGVIFGFLAFREKNFVPKIIGSVLMVAGVILISQS